MNTHDSFSNAATPEGILPVDEITTRNGSTLRIAFFKHASLAIGLNDRYHIYVDPVDQYADYANLPKADLILVTHSHYDHLDTKAIDKLRRPDTVIVCDHTSADSFDRATAMRPGAHIAPCAEVSIEAVAAYNTTEGHTQFHPKMRGDCGYLLTIDGTRIYISGDTEPTGEMLSLQDLDIAFLPVNQPYTMTVDQAAEVIRQIRPRIFYPYHYGEVEERTDIDRLVRKVGTLTDIRIRPME